jgi:hypothetical protein
MLLLVMAAILFATSPIFAGETKVGGQVWAKWQLHLNNQTVNNVKMGKSFNSFDIDRARLILDQKFSDRYEANIMADIYRPSSGDNPLQFRLRSAYIQVNSLVKYTTMRFGMQSFVFMDRLEKVWNLRFIDATAMEKLGYISRADVGVGFIAECPGNYGTIALQILNGGGYAQPENNKFKDFVGFIQALPMPKNPDFGECALLAQYYKGYPNILDVSDDSTSRPGFTKSTRKDRLEIGGVFKYKKWGTAYVEYFTAWDKSDLSTVKTKENTEKANGLSLFGRVNVAASETWLARVYLFGKYEWLDMHTQIDNGVNPFGAQEGDSRYITAGIGYSPVDGYDLALTVKRNTTNKNDNNLQITEEEANTLYLFMQAKF